MSKTILSTFACSLNIVKDEERDGGVMHVNTNHKYVNDLVWHDNESVTSKQLTKYFTLKKSSI